MATERRDRIKGLYRAALERAPDDRAAFLQEACAGSDELRLEVESLLRYDTPSAASLETPAVDAVAATLAASSAAMIGREFGPYQITSPLGAGGMGEVYRARDRKLGRDVAIKILPQEFTADPERRGRFAREARVLATLQSPAHRRHLRAGRGRRSDRPWSSSWSRGRRWRTAFARAAARCPMRCRSRVKWSRRSMRRTSKASSTAT